MKIRTRIFLVFIILMAVGLFSFVRWMQGEMRPRYMEAQEDTLVDMSQLLASQVSSQGVSLVEGQPEINTAFLQLAFRELLSRQVDAQIYELHKQQVDIRIYVTDRNGKVIFDSDSGRDLNADYSRWRDVSLTLKGKYGARSTDFDPLYADGSIMYIAAPITFNNDIIGVVSVGKPTRNAERFMSYLLSNISSVGLLILLIAIITGVALNGWISRPLSRLQQYAQAVTRGERTSLPALGNNEMGDVGQAMESMRKALDGKTYVSDYVQSLTHELKSPIAAIQGAAELLEEDMPVESRQRFLGNIRSQGQRMQELIERLLDLAELEYRPKLENTSLFYIKPLLEEVINSFQPLSEKLNVQLHCQCNESLRIQADRFLLSNALNNIVKNALEFSPTESKIILSAKKQDKTVLISICDQGPGIPDYAKAKIFDRFFSVARPDGQKGSGLGLSFVKEIATLHKAGLKVLDNEQAKTGTCIELQFPLKQG